MKIHCQINFLKLQVFGIAGLIVLSVECEKESDILLGVRSSMSTVQGMRLSKAAWVRTRPMSPIWHIHTPLLIAMSTADAMASLEAWEEKSFAITPGCRAARREFFGGGFRLEHTLRTISLYYQQHKG